MHRHMQISTGIWGHLPLYGARLRAALRSAADHAMPDAQDADGLPGDARLPRVPRWSRIAM